MTPVDFSRLMDYPHVPLMLAGRTNPLEVIRQINASASSPSHDGIDQPFREVCDAYRAGEGTHREHMRATVTHRDSLLHFAHRMAVRLLRTRDVNDLRHGLLALSLEDLRTDPRETVGRVAMLRYAAEETGSDWETEFHSIMSISSAAFATFWQDSMSSPRSQNPVCLKDYALRHITGVDGDTIEFAL